MPLVAPTPILPQPQAPQPTDDRVTFSIKAFAWVASMEATRVAFNLAAVQTNTNAAFAHERADAAQASAKTATSAAQAADQSRAAADKALSDARAALDAINAGPVASVNGRTGVVAGLQEAFVQKHASAGAEANTALAVGTEYSLYTVATYWRSLPANPKVGDKIILNNLHNTWGNGLFTLKRANAGHAINGLVDDVIFNTNDFKRAELTYMWENSWVMALS